MNVALRRGHPRGPFCPACPLNILLWRIVVVDGESYQRAGNL